jgi:hypothetical protein
MLSCISNKATFLRKKKLSVKNKKHADRTITHLCGSVKRKNVMVETDYSIESAQPKI